MSKDVFDGDEAEETTFFDDKDDTRTGREEKRESQVVFERGGKRGRGKFTPYDGRAALRSLEEAYLRPLRASENETRKKRGVSKRLSFPSSRSSKKERDDELT